jgi:hypothetical protein
MRETVDGREVVTIDQWAVKGDDGFVVTSDLMKERYGHGYSGPKLFLDIVSAHEWIAEQGMVDKWEAVPVLVEIREVTRSEYDEFRRKDNA